MIEKLHHYNCKLDRVVDGDTVKLIIDLGFKIKVAVSLRLVGIDTPEKRSSNGLEQKAAYKSELYLEKMIKGKDLMVTTKKNDMYGRYVGTLYVKDGNEVININNIMLNKGLAKEYKGGHRKPWSDEELNEILKK